MTKHSITTHWRGNTNFETDLDGHTIAIDLSKESGGEDKGPRPKKLALVAATGCTGIDVIDILKKMRVDVKAFKLHIDAEVSENHPVTYTSMHLVYEFESNENDASKIERACKMSFDNYCGITALYKKAIPVTYEVKIKSI